MIEKFLSVFMRNISTMVLFNEDIMDAFVILMDKVSIVFGKE
jgi:hypothetical protein